MGAYHNALREEGSREDLLRALEKAWARIEVLENERLWHPIETLWETIGGGTGMHVLVWVPDIEGWCFEAHAEMVFVDGNGGMEPKDRNGTLAILKSEAYPTHWKSITEPPSEIPAATGRRNESEKLG